MTSSEQRLFNKSLLRIQDLNPRLRNGDVLIDLDFDPRTPEANKRALAEEFARVAFGSKGTVEENEGVFSICLNSDPASPRQTLSELKDFALKRIVEADNQRS